MAIYCTDCGKSIPEDSMFCGFCGLKLTKTGTAQVADKTPQKAVTLFDKFAEIHDSTGEEREKYNALISPATWTIMNNLANNDLEKMLSKHEEIKQETYAFVQALRLALQLSYPGGYRLYLANRLLYKKSLSTFEHEPSEEELRKELQKIDFNTEYAKIGLDARMVIDTYSNFRFNSLFESYFQSQKRMNTKALEALRGEIMGGIIWGYFFGQIEDKYRK
ncbi:MAG: zinc ribbon domain-containing protein [Candidatus Peribacteraceae bacterium]|nr:zinc ribbon domain-containing protein [Candidatus Peribacteraceae bacterium]